LSFGGRKPDWRKNAFPEGFKLDRKIRVLMAKCGRDGHTRGATIVTNALKNAGMEVILLGIHKTADEVVEAAMQEDVDVIGLSQLDGGHMTVFRRTAHLLKEKGANDVLLVGGGIIPEDEICELKDEGVDEIFGPGTPLKEIVKYIQEHVRPMADHF
jgi:methylmalonyl-CoA mutase C-terminal domain/subunit